MHQLRYLAAHGERAGEALAREGHGYLATLGPVVAVLCAVALAQLAVAWQRRQAPGDQLALSRLWALGAVSLLVIYGLQESLEGVLAAGHAGGVDALLGSGGWTAVPLALALGLLVGLLLRAAGAVLAARARRVSARVLPRDAARPAAQLRSARVPVLATHLAGRAPPPIEL